MTTFDNSSHYSIFLTGTDLSSAERIPLSDAIMSALVNNSLMSSTLEIGNTAPADTTKYWVDTSTVPAQTKYWTGTAWLQGDFTQFFPFQNYVLKEGDDMTGPLLGADGTLSDPMYSFAGDTDTGIVRTAAGSIGFVSEGTLIATIDSTGLNVVGTTTTVDTTDLAISDNEIILNAGETGAGITAGTSGIRVERGTLTDATAVFDEADGGWKLSDDLYVAGFVSTALNATGVGGYTFDGIDSGLSGNALGTLRLRANGVTGITMSDTTSYIESTNFRVGTAMPILNEAETGAGVTAGQAGIEVERGTLTNASLYFDETLDAWVAHDGTAAHRIANKHTVAATPPTGATIHDTYWDTDNDVVFMLLNDGTNDVWLDFVTTGFISANYVESNGDTMTGPLTAPEFISTGPITSAEIVTIGSYPLASLPAAAASNGAIAFVTDINGGRHVYSNGVNWRRFHNNGIVA